MLIMTNLKVSNENAITGNKVWNIQLIDATVLDDLTSITHLCSKYKVEVGSVGLNLNVNNIDFVIFILPKSYCPRQETPCVARV